MICYTRNFEDVILQRVFKDMLAGRYVDVGACFPRQDSNTYALYEKGWCGLVVEPLLTAEMRSEWARFRPRDIVAEVAVGQEEGLLDFHLFPQRQISSGDPATVEHWKRHGNQPVQTIKVPKLRLSSLYEKHFPTGDWHLLSVDVEGMELDVLRGLDLTAHRPWMMVIEAVLPGLPSPNHMTWEPHLLAQGYQFAYFDGVNRFYVAHERRHLLRHFDVPPNVWDEITMATELELRRRLELADAEVARLRSELAALRK
jgi:FkbM family methyltransferase